MRVVGKNTIAISEELQDKMQPDETNELENIFDTDAAGDTGSKVIQFLPEKDHEVGAVAHNSNEKIRKLL